MIFIPSIQSRRIAVFTKNQMFQVVLIHPTEEASKRLKWNEVISASVIITHCQLNHLKPYVLGVCH